MRYSAPSRGVKNASACHTGPGIIDAFRPDDCNRQPPKPRRSAIASDRIRALAAGPFDAPLKRRREPAGKQLLARLARQARYDAD